MANRVLGYLYISDYETALDINYLNKLGIRKIVSVGVELKCPHKTIEYIHIPIMDEPSVNIKKYFDLSNGFIAKHLPNEPVLVHCQMGISRSATIVLAFLMYFYGLDLRCAFTLLKHRRRIINPNYGFREQLKQYQEEIKDRSEIPINNYK